MPQTHIFLDNSNIYGGAQRVAQQKESAPWPCVRIYYKSLFRLLRHGKSDIGTAMLAGSVPPGAEDLWDAAREAGFDTTLLQRVASDTGRLVEQGVDEAIHLRISNILLDSDYPGAIVIASGDGAQGDQDCSFTDQVIRAAKRGWQVEVWSWQSQLAKRLRDTRIRYPDQVRIQKLDEWYGSLVFLKGGVWHMPAGDMTIANRGCAGLNLTESTFLDASIT